MTYEENVRKIAKEIAQTRYSDYAERSKTMQRKYNLWERTAARIAVRLQAESVVEYLKSSWGDYAPNPDKYLIEHGLIPTPECKHEHLIDIPRGKNGERYGPRCKDCGVFVQC